MILSVLIFLLVTHAFESSTNPVPEDAGKLIGGSKAKAGQFPYAASIVYQTKDGVYFCAGTLWGTQWIITGGQCVQNAIQFTIHLGTNDRLGLNGQPFTTTNYLLHPEFSSNPLMNDLGLIKLRLPVTLNNYIKPISNLPNSDLPDEFVAVTIGWGSTSDSDEHLSDELHWVYVSTLPINVCKTVYGDQITDEKVCVAGNSNEGTCLGDSGGPLLDYVSQTKTTLVAISSFISTKGCESYDPSGFTRIYPFKGWIVNQTSVY